MIVSPFLSLRRAALCAAALSLFAAPAARAQLPTANLLQNPGAEAPGSVAGDVAFWTLGDGDGQPSVDNGSFDPGIDPHSGGFDFFGVNGLKATLFQTVSLTGSGVTPALIDAGNLQANVSFWEQGLNQGDPSDNARVLVSYLDFDNALLGTDITDTVDSHDGTWKRYAGSFVIPANTRSLRYAMEFNRHQGSDNDAFVDDNVLTVSKTASVVVPEAGALPLLLLASGVAVLALAFRAARKASRGSAMTITRFAGTVAAGMLITGGASAQTVVNVDATTTGINGSTLLASTKVTLTAGTYILTPTNPTLNTQALYTAWNFNPSDQPSWVWYALGYDDGQPITPGAPLVNVDFGNANSSLGTPRQALNQTYTEPCFSDIASAYASVAGKTQTLTLTKTTTIDFITNDSVPSDNLGGVSFVIARAGAAVPEAGTAALIALGGVAIAVVARRRAAQKEAK